MPSKKPNEATITLKEVYERVISLEATIGGAIDDGKKSSSRFGVVIVLLVLAIIFDIGLHIYLHLLEGAL